MSGHMPDSGAPSLPPFLAALLAGQAHTFQPPMDIAIVGGAILIRADVPGLEIADVSVRLQGGTLIIAGERKDDLEGVPRIHHERPHSGFRRLVPLNESLLDTEATPSAAVKRGVLTVTIPLREEDPGQEIPITDEVE